MSAARTQVCVCRHTYPGSLLNDFDCEEDTLAHHKQDEKVDDENDGHDNGNRQEANVLALLLVAGLSNRVGIIIVILRFLVWMSSEVSNQIDTQNQTYIAAT